MFGRINNGNSVSIPLGLNFGWAGEINLQCTLEKLFEGEFGIGYPPEDADRKRQDTMLLKEINALTKRNAIDVFERLDKALIEKVFQKSNVVEYILEYGRDKEIFEFIRSKGEIPVNPRNYKPRGFETSCNYGIIAGESVHLPSSECLMVKELQDGALQDIKGTMDYSYYHSLT